MGTEFLPYFPCRVVVRTKRNHISGSAWETDLLPPTEWDLMLLFVTWGSKPEEQKKSKTGNWHFFGPLNMFLILQETLQNLLTLTASLEAVINIHISQMRE